MARQRRQRQARIASNAMRQAQEPAPFDFSPARNASRADYEAGLQFFRQNPPNQPFLPTLYADQVERLRTYGPPQTLVMGVDTTGAGQVSVVNAPYVEFGRANDGLTTIVRFTHTTGKDLSLITQIPMPCCIDQATYGSMFYFEVRIVRLFNDVAVAVGLCSKPYPYFRLPGWHEMSIAYHSDDGHKYVNDSKGGRGYGPACVEGDVIGCGYDAVDGTVTFTRNGQTHGMAATCFYAAALYPAIGADGPCELDVNFGQREFWYKGREATQYMGRVPIAGFSGPAPYAFTAPMQQSLQTQPQQFQPSYQQPSSVPPHLQQPQQPYQGGMPMPSMGPPAVQPGEKPPPYTPV
ncbi:SPRY-domain-containing protein [Ramicandelaber brevisporus]|nr:SPRY-domain-containing protein [Ramicandelaber brevisporus]